MKQFPPKRISLAACITIKSSNNKYRLTKRSSKISYPNSWVAPGGSLDPNESMEECAIRESFEETGIKLDPSKVTLTPFYMYEAFNGPRKGYYRHHLIVYYLAETGFTDEEVEVIVQPAEVQEYRWIDETELKGYVEESSKLDFGEGEGDFVGVYPNKDGLGMPEGHFQALNYLFFRK